MRRYNHSCDQCRKSKRACDAPQLTLPDHAGDSAASLLGGNLPAPQLKPCSYCSKTRKSCTMNWAWSQLRVAVALEAASRGNLGLESLVPAKRPTEGESSGNARPAMETTSYQTPATTDHFALQGDLGLDDPSISPVDLPGPLPDNLFNFDVLGNLPEVIASSDMGFDFPTSVSLDGSLPYAVPDLPSPDWFPSQFHQHSTGMRFSFSESTDADETIDSTTQESCPSSSYSGRSGSMTRPPDPKRRRQTRPRATSSLSPFSADSAMMSRSNNGLISSNLLQIYHDVLEHNLSCWLTEASCPYKGARGREEGRRLAEWGPSWSNRIFERTLKLDKAAQSTGLTRLTRSEDQAARRALHYAIMAFATQWAQGSHRQRERYTFLGNTFECDVGSGFDELTEGFDRDLQRHFWTQAQKALQEADHVECFKVVCAELVFGLAQKPWAQDDAQATSHDAWRTPNPAAPFEQASLTSEISQAISKDGPPVHIERAIRKMHMLKFRFDSATRSTAKARHGQRGQPPAPFMSEEDETTVGLLYWLVVMFDTVSSSMNERPITVTDQDCQHDGAPADDTDHDDRWKVDLFIKDTLDAPSLDIHWPCSYEDAAESVTRSGPVKVLLYRHVAYLQSLLRRRRPAPQCAEDIIRSATSLYRYWNVTHGAFFRELVRDFAVVPSRIRSWFFCISAHWHLAALMLADLIECVDDEGLGLPAPAQRRAATSMVATMRESSVRELSDLARVAVPPAVSATEPQLPEFHHAVNEGTVLTEPWTVILIRAFSRAAVLILKEADNYRRYGLATSRGSDDEMWNTLGRAEDCIKTLFYLGKKSDMARRVADVLSGALASLKPPQYHGVFGTDKETWAYEAGQISV